jgi:hypothetical protein
MTSEIERPTFRCSKCGTRYGRLEQWERCVRRPVLNDRGVKVGDVVRVTRGRFAGRRASVFLVNVMAPSSLPYGEPDEYWHTVGVYVLIQPGKPVEGANYVPDEFLTWDEYETLPNGGRAKAVPA